MNKEEIYSNLTKDLPDLEIYIDEPMNKHTSFKIGGPADLFIKVSKIEEIEYIIEFCNNNDIPLTAIGNGSNLLVKDNGIRGITLKIEFDDIDFSNEDVVVGSGVKVIYLSMLAQKEELTGLEFACGIPGTIGGAVRMNAGAYGEEFKDIIEEVTFITRQGEIKTLDKDNLEFSYRNSRFCNSNDIVLSAKLKLQKGNSNQIKVKMEEYLNSRKEKQPIDIPNAGSTFKRGEDFISSKLIDEAGLKGYTIGGAKVSEKHAGFIVNVGNATAKDVIELIEYVKKIVYEKFGKELELELEIVGE